MDTRVLNAKFKPATQKLGLSRFLQARSNGFLTDRTRGERSVVAFGQVMAVYGIGLAIVSLLALRQDLNTKLTFLNVPVHDLSNNR